VVIRLKVPIEMHYTVIPMGTSKVNSSLIFFCYMFSECHILSLREYLRNYQSTANILCVLAMAMASSSSSSVVI